MPFGGPPEEETFIRFGMGNRRFIEKLWQIIDEVGCDSEVARHLADVYPPPLPGRRVR